MWRERGTLQEWKNRILQERADSKDDLLWLKGVQFGDKLSERGSLRHDKNVNSLTAIIVEHDLGTVSFEEALATLRRAGIQALIYTSPSYRSKESERWRIVAPLSGIIDQDIWAQHAALVARLNGVLGGELAIEFLHVVAGLFLRCRWQQP